MNLLKDSATLHDFKKSTQLEWLETNGIGGYASSTIIGTNTRRYHGLLVAATQPPVGRMNLLSKMDETIVFADESFELGCNQYRDAISPKGNQFLKSFSREIFPEWIYEIRDEIVLKKTIAALQGENTTLIIYEVLKAKTDFTLELLPLVAARDFHSLAHANDSINRDAIFKNFSLKILPYDHLQPFYIFAPDAEFHAQPDWYYNFQYDAEEYRGLDHTEDLFCYGKFLKKLSPGEIFGIIISTENPASNDALLLFTKEKERRENVIFKKDFENPFFKTLLLAAAQFIVNRGDGLKTIIAGYHWFSDWGRDTMIALPGLCLMTGRLDDAKNILRAFAANVSQGMIPNRFPDSGEAPEYNTIDATLWFFIAVFRFKNAANDTDFVLKELLPVLRDCMTWHINGTRYDIHADSDGLLTGGESGEQLTWMDARVGGKVITPRTGKAVEINALWYNAMIIFAALLKENGETEEAEIWLARAERTKLAFKEFFWNDAKKCLFDYGNPGFKNDSIRPNQLFAISLPFPLIEGDEAENVLKIIEVKLLTPVGLRSLSPDDAEYHGHYGGNQWERDSAYHQGTVWSWLLGPYIDALLKIRGEAGKNQAKEIIGGFKKHLGDACIGSVSEIFDGDFPHAARGCVAQAWSVGEILRVCVEYDLVEN